MSHRLLHHFAESHRYQLSSSGLGTPNIKEIVNIIGHVQSATSKAQSKLVSRFGLHEFSLHWCECFCSSYIARRLHWGASLPGPSLKPCFRWVFPMFVSAIRMCSRCRGGDKCSQTNIEFRFVVLQKRGETSLHKCADLQVSSCPPEMNLFDVNCLANFTCCMPWKPHPTGLPLTNAWCLAAVVFTQLLDGPWQKVTKIRAFPVPGSSGGWVWRFLVQWFDHQTLISGRFKYQELRFSARYQTMNQRHKGPPLSFLSLIFLILMICLDSNLSLKLRDCYHGMNATVFPI